MIPAKGHEPAQKAYFLERLRFQLERRNVMMVFVPSKERSKEGFWRPIIQEGVYDSKYIPIMHELLQSPVQECFR